MHFYPGLIMMTKGTAVNQGHPDKSNEFPTLIKSLLMGKAGHSETLAYKGFKYNYRFEELHHVLLPEN